MSAELRNKSPLISCAMYRMAMDKFLGLIEKEWNYIFTEI